MLKEKISQVDKRLLESLEAKYESVDLIAAINAIADPIINVPAEDVVNVKDEVVSCEEATLDFLRSLEGHVIRLQEIHWNTPKKRTHDATNDIIELLRTLIDDVAENMQGLLGIRIKVGSVQPILPRYINEIDGFKEILDCVLTFKASMDSVQGFSGVISQLDDVIGELNKQRYLNSFE